MKNYRDSGLVLALGVLLLTACDVDVQEHGKDKNVDVRTPFGNVSVRTNEAGPDTGLPVYPGAQPLRDDDQEAENAEIKVKTAWVGVHVTAAKYESKDAPRAIADFYKDKLSTFGTVVECNGEVEFEGEPKQPVCEEDTAAHEIQLVTGTEEKHRLVSVKPRGEGSEFAVVSIQIDERS
jgi:hypothetical protein